MKLSWKETILLKQKSRLILAVRWKGHFIPTAPAFHWNEVLLTEILLCQTSLFSSVWSEWSRTQMRWSEGELIKGSQSADETSVEIIGREAGVRIGLAGGAPAAAHRRLHRSPIAARNGPVRRRRPENLWPNGGRRGSWNIRYAFTSNRANSWRWSRSTSSSLPTAIVFQSRKIPEIGTLDWVRCHLSDSQRSDPVSY